MSQNDQKHQIGAAGAAGYRTNRRRLLKGAAVAAGAAMIPSVVRPGHFVAAETTLNILAPQWPQGPKEQALAAEWAKTSGIGVKFEAVNYASLEQRIKLLVESKSADYDVYDYDSQWIGGFVEAGVFERLDTPEYLGKTGSAVKLTDFFPEITGRLVQYPDDESALAAGKPNPNPVYGLPWSLNAEALWYRKDLMDAAPDTWDALRAKAKELTKDGMYGYAVQGGRDADWIISETNPIMWANGGEIWDSAKYQAEGILNSAGNVASLQMLVDMVNTDKSIDPASANWTINERLGALLTGKAAMCLNWAPLFGGVADDPKASQVVGKIGLAPSPKGSVRRAAMIGCQGTAINSASAHKAEAWTYLQWWQSKETQAAMMADAPSGFLSARQDLRDSAQFEFQKVFLTMIPDMRDMWNIAEYAQLLQILQTELSLAYVGKKSAKDALDNAAIAQQAVLDGSPRKPKA